MQSPTVSDSLRQTVLTHFSYMVSISARPRSRFDYHGNGTSRDEMPIGHIEDIYADGVIPYSLRLSMLIEAQVQGRSHLNPRRRQ